MGVKFEIGLVVLYLMIIMLQIYLQEWDEIIGWCCALMAQIKFLMVYKKL